MATIINNPPGSGDGRNTKNEGSGVGIVIGTIIAILLVVLFFIYLLPVLRGSSRAQTQQSDQNPGGQTNVNVQLPNPIPAPTSNASSQ